MSTQACTGRGAAPRSGGVHAEAIGVTTVYFASADQPVLNTTVTGVNQINMVGRTKRPALNISIIIGCKKEKV